MLSDKITITHYEELQTFLRMFKAKDLQLLIIIGSTGTGKTQAIKEILQETKCLFQTSHSTPLALYNELYQHRNELVILEDLDSLLSSDRAISLLKALCETTKVKKLCYLTTSQLLKAPTSYETASSVLISCNQLHVKNTNIKALLNRGLCIEFKPQRQEILKKMHEIVQNIDVVSLDAKKRLEALALIEENAPYASNLNLRTLVRGLQLRQYAEKDKGFDWKANLLKLMDVDAKLREVVELGKTNLPVKEQVKRFSGSRASFYRVRKKVSKS